ncbi:MAG: hypothetical protein LBI15_06025 [Dysgonamonadaceae bacterium]|jgi:hypothetical protein|nr:hypothetical protein [Dysgonamonadaceae bacterium]
MKHEEKEIVKKCLHLTSVAVAQQPTFSKILYQMSLFKRVSFFTDIEIEKNKGLF